jgi:hypothetical protein
MELLMFSSIQWTSIQSQHNSRTATFQSLNQVVSCERAAQAVAREFATETAHRLAFATELKAQVITPQTGTQQLQGAAV